MNFNFPKNISIFLEIRYLENLLFAPTDTNIILLLFYFGFSQCQSGRVVKGARRLLDACCSDSVGSNPTNTQFNTFLKARLRPAHCEARANFDQGKERSHFAVLCQL